MCQSIVAGGIYFDEFAELAGWRAFFFSAGLLAAIAGALGMGCASFIAEQHVMISYTILPGERSEWQDGCLARTVQQSVAKRLNRFNLIHLLVTLQHLTSCAGYGTDAESLLDQSKMRAYGLQFAGLGAAGGPGELQMQDLSPRAPGDGDDTDVEEGGPPGADGDGGSAPAGGSRGSSAAELPKAGCGPLERLQTESAAWHCSSACRPAERTAIVLGHRARPSCSSCKHGSLNSSSSFQYWVSSDWHNAAYVISKRGLQ